MALAGYEPDPTIKLEPTPPKKRANKQHRRRSPAKASHANDKPIKQRTTSNVASKTLARKNPGKV